MSLETWQRLALPEHAALLAAAADADPGNVAAVARLRKLGDPALVSAALTLCEARRKAAAKFGQRATTLWADPQGIEMASSVRAADHKTARMVRVLGRVDTLDVCCGIGGDAMSMAAAGLRVTCVDLDPARAWMAGINAACPSLVADAADARIVTPGTRLLHIDPSRRTGDGDTKRRLYRLADLQPGPAVVRSLIDRVAASAKEQPWGAAVKLGPGVNAAELPEIVGDHPAELEIISERGRLTQGVVWVGDLALHTRSATLLDEHHAHTLAGTPDRPPPVGDLDAYLFEPDDCVERAGMLAELCDQAHAWMPHPAAGLLAANTPIDHPLLTGFQVLGSGPWNQRRVRQALYAHGAGIVEVKTRGGLVDPDAMQSELRGPGTETLTLFVVRFGDHTRAIVARRLPPPG